MVISHRHRYLFLELAHTASTAVSKELREHYDGQLILAKHSTYRDFLRIATDDEKTYFVFSCIRHPLDVAVTKYFKRKTDQNRRWSDPAKAGGSRDLGKVLDRRTFRFIHDNDADFAKFFLRFYRLPYNSWACLDHKNLDLVMRFESLEADFAEALRRIGIEQVRPLPARNVTGERQKSFFDYYDTPAAIERAKRVFGVYLQEWGFELPREWGELEISALDRVAYDVRTFLLKMYWLHLKRWVWRQEMRPVLTPSSTPAGA
jgi:hypothetical protein